MRTLPELPIRPSGDVIFTDSCELGAAADDKDAAATRNPAAMTEWRRWGVATMREPSPTAIVCFAPLQQGERVARGYQRRVDRQRGPTLTQTFGCVALLERQIAEVVQRIGCARVELDGSL